MSFDLKFPSARFPRFSQNRASVGKQNQPSWRRKTAAHVDEKNQPSERKSIAPDQNQNVLRIKEAITLLKRKFKEELSSGVVIQNSFGHAILVTVVDNTLSINGQSRWSHNEFKTLTCWVNETNVMDAIQASISYDSKTPVVAAQPDKKDRAGPLWNMVPEAKVGDKDQKPANCDTVVEIKSSK
jgi:hypothetical protein